MTAYPLDGLPAPTLCYSTRRLRNAYTANAAFDLAYNSTVKTIGFVNGGLPDIASAASFCSAAGTACYVTQWYDQCGSGYNATSAGNVNSPIWNSANNVAGLSPIIFPFDNQGDKTSMSIPTTFRWEPGNPTTIFVVGQFLNSLNSSWFWQGGQFDGQLANAGPTSGPPGISLRPTAGTASSTISTTPADNEPAIIGVEWRDGSFVAHSNDQISTTTVAATGSAETGGYLGASGGTSGGGTANEDSFDATAVLVYSNYASAASYAKIQALLASTFNIQQSFSNAVVEDGDSFSSGKGSSFDNSIFRFALMGTKYAVRGYNNAVPGLSMAQVNSAFATNIPSYYQSGYARFIVHFAAGPNDIRFGFTVASIYANFQSYINKVHALGSNARAVIATNPLQCDIFQNPTELAALESLNAMISANWNVPQASGGLGADDLDDRFAVPVVGPGNYNGSVFCGFPNTYSPDGQHPTDYSMSLFGPTEAASINALLP